MTNTDNDESVPAERPYVLLTGATGYLGKHVVRDLLKDGWQVGVILRSRYSEPGGRMHDAMAPMGHYDGAHIEVYEGDLSEADCGLTAAAIIALRKKKILAVVDCAGMMRMDAKLAADAYSNNLKFIEHVYQLSELLHIRNLLYMSSAEVAGDAVTAFSQNDLDVGQSFNNAFGRSKFDAEKYLLAQSAESGGPNIRIYRPSIVVGGSPGNASSRVNNIYAFVKTMRAIREACRRDLDRGEGKFFHQGMQEYRGRMSLALRIAGKRQSKINLVLVSQVVNEVIADLNRIEAEGIEKYSAKSLFGQDFILEDLQRITEEVLRISGVDLVSTDSFTVRPKTRLEQLFSRTVAGIQPYFFAHRAFPDGEKNHVYLVNLKSIMQRYCDNLDKSAGRSARETLNKRQAHEI